MTDPSSGQLPPSQRKGALPVAGCVLALMAVVIVFGLAVGGSYRGLIVLGALLVALAVGGFAFLVKRNAGR
jgi:lipopolysaccharide export LptBFGC system permease protein LptF